MQSIRIASYNVNGLHNPIKRGKILSQMKKEKIQVGLIQETHLNDLEHAKLNRMGFKHVYYSSHGSGRRRGVAILLAKGLNYEHIKKVSDTEGRYVMTIGKLEGTVITFLNVYSPPDSNWDFYKKIINLMATKSQGIVICGGDFNLHLNPKLDVSRGNSELKLISKRTNTLMKEMGIVDIWREFFPTRRDYTYYSTPHAVYTRIDYFFTFSRHLHIVKESNIGSMTLSDHSPIYLTLSLKGERRETLWRLNSTILNNIDTKESLKQEINTYLELNDNGEVTPDILWDTLKAVMRGKIISITSHMKKVRVQKLKDLEGELKQLQREHSRNLDEQIKQELDKIKKQIQDMSTQEIQNKLTFLKQRYYEVGGKATKLLAYKLRKQQADNTIHKIRHPELRTMQYGLKNIQENFENYYKTLYSQPPKDNDLEMDTFFASIRLPSVSEEENKTLISDITIEELNSAISRLKASKSPGTDGFTAEWYKALREQMAPILLRTFNWVLQEKKIPPSWKEAIISLIPKEGKDQLECGSYRPISILNVDYKLFTSILSHRINRILPRLIHTDQTGFIKQRQTHDNLRRTLHIVNHIEQQSIEALLVSLDAEKAYDSVRWKFLYRVLAKFGFHESFISVFQALYDNPTARIKVNGALSKSITLERGTRQGCPASPLLFALFIEPLSQWIRQNANLKGIRMYTDEQKLALFADDVLVYLVQPTLTFPRLMDTLDKYGSISGYKLNIGKTQVLTFNYVPPAHLIQKYDLRWNADHIKYLGVNIPRDIKKLFNLNYIPLSNNIRADLQRWNLIPFLNLNSKVESIRMNILPRLLYLFQALPVEVSTNQFTEWDKLISRFLWQGKKPRTRYKTLQLSKEKGGLNLPNLRDYYYAAQLRPLVCWSSSHYTARWKDIEMAMSGEIPLAAIIADCELRKNMINKNNPWVNAGLKIWHRIIQFCNIERPLRKLKWCAFDNDFPPAITDTRFRMWTEKGLTNYTTFAPRGVVKCFETMQKDHGLQRQDFYRYLQVRHHYNQNVAGTFETTGKGVVEVFEKAITSQICLKVVSRLYSSIRRVKPDGTHYIKEKWEKESGLQISAENWENICTLQWEVTCSNSWREFSWKNVSRFFRTPLQQRKLMPNVKCWRACGQIEANHFHVFWDCPVLETYWREVHTHMEAVFGTNIPYRFDIMYLGNIVLEDWTYNDRKLLLILQAASKKAITRRWLKPDSPKISDWLDVIHDIYVMEKMTYSLRIQTEKFSRIWNKWTEYIQHIRMDFC